MNDSTPHIVDFARYARIAAENHQREAALSQAIDNFLREQPTQIECDTHADQKRDLAVDDTKDHCRTYPSNPDGWKPTYYSCPICREEHAQKRLRQAGVPEVLLHASLDNWKPKDRHEKQHLADVSKFAEEIRRGFLVLLGPVGTGKSHLAVACLRRFNSGVFVKQSSLLRKLRATYNDRNASDPIDRCQAASLLVLDEMGLSGGGRDEAPMLSEILSYRYERRLPTVVTSNLTWNELTSELGDRLADRMREAAFRILTFDGASHRAAMRDAYFAGKGQADTTTRRNGSKSKSCL